MGLGGKPEREDIYIYIHMCVCVFIYISSHTWASQVVQLVKKPPAMQETLIQFLGWEDPLEKG